MASEPGIWSVASHRRERRLGVEIGHFLRHVDYLLLAGAGGLIACGLWILSSVTANDVPGDPTYFVDRQAIAVAIGAAVLAVLAALDPDVFRRHRMPLYLVAIALLAVVMFAPEVREARRWIELGFFRLQPSELGKVLLVLVLAGFLADRARRGREARTVAAAIGLAVAPALLVFLEPDFGTTLVYGALLVGALYFVGTRATYLAGLTLAGVAVASAMLWFLPENGVQVLKPYQLDRLAGFLNPDADPTGTTYNINQSITAVGSGGLDGRGVLGATQTRLDYLPEHATDFVFSSLAEQRGFLGASVLLLLYALVVWRGIKIVALARDLFSAVAAGAIVAAFLFQVFFNVGMTIGLVPLAGIPLPFVSYGGSSMVSSLAMIGLLEAFHVRGRLAGTR